MRNHLWASVALASLLGGCSNTKPRLADEPAEPTKPGPAAPTAVEPVALGLTAAPDEAAALDGPPQAFRFTKLSDVVARITTPSVPSGVFHVKAKLVSPSGVIHQEISIPYSTDPQVTTVKMGDTAIHVRRPRRILGGWAVELSLPVAGTEAQLRPEPGDWKLFAALDGQPPLEVTLKASLPGGAP